MLSSGRNAKAPNSTAERAHLLDGVTKIFAVCSGCRIALRSASPGLRPTCS